MSAFDLIAVQEVNENMTDFQTVMRLLGPHWNYLVTDQSGNMERLAFVYDTRKILFRHIAGEVVLPAKKGKPPLHFNRTPYLVAFQSGCFKFNICTVRIYYGDAKTPRNENEKSRMSRISSASGKRRTAKPTFCWVTSTSSIRKTLP
jgi:hypothetical protein